LTTLMMWLWPLYSIVAVAAAKDPASIFASKVKASAPEASLMVARAALDRAPGSDQAKQLVDAASALQDAEIKCASDKQCDKSLNDLLMDVRQGYSKRAALLQSKPKDLVKLQKALTKAEAKANRAQSELDDDDLKSPEDRAALASAKAAVDAARIALNEAKAAAAASARRTILLKPLSSLATKDDFQVVSTSPMVLVRDDWLGATGSRALDELPALLDAALDPPSTEEGASVEKLPTSAEDMGNGEEYAPKGSRPRLCLPFGGTAEEHAATDLLGIIDVAVDSAKFKGDNGEEHCAATAGLVDKKPAEWDEAEDGEWSGKYVTASDRYIAGAAHRCGPLTPAIDKALVRSDSVRFTASAEVAIDVLDAAMSEAAGFTLDAEKLASEIYAGLVERVDTSASIPDTWDVEEDGEWEAPMLPASTTVDLLAKLLKRGGANASGLHEAYSFSSGVELSRFRPATGGGSKLRAECDDWNTTSAKPLAAVTAILIATGDGKSTGGAVVFPALGITVPPRHGRLLLFESVLPSGECDPSSSYMVKQLDKSEQDVLLLKKSYFSDRSYSREENEGEGPSRGGHAVDCSVGTSPLHDCRRFEVVPATSGDFVIPLREGKASKHRNCMAQNELGPCFDPDWKEPPKQPKQPKPPKPTAATTTMTSEPETPKPLAPVMPGAPPPLPDQLTPGPHP